MTQLIKRAYLVGAPADAQVNPDGTGDVLIDSNGRIEAIAPNISNFSEETEVIDAQGQYLGPGLIDLYSQSGEPGHEQRETLNSLRAAATAGGFTRLGLLPTTIPAIDNGGALSQIIRQASPTATPSQTALMPWAAITLAAEGQQLTELAELAQAGALGFTDAAPINNPILLRRLLEYAQPLQKPIALWPCDSTLAGSGVAREGIDSLRLGLLGVSTIAETSAIAKLLEYVAEVPTPIHLMRISTARSVVLLRQAKAAGLPISASVPWHHLLFDTQDLLRYNPSLRHDPPLGTPSDRQALIEGVTEGVIDAIAIDHSPYTYEEKTVAFDSAPPGAIGLELALPVLWQTFVASNRWSPAELWQRLSYRPAECLGITAPKLSIGETAELTLFDPRVSWQVIPEALRSLSYNTPWAGQQLQGKVTRVWNSHLSVT